jgi:4-aminobutyrate aminotransferase-like enzyme
VVERMKSFGILLSTDGPFHNVIKFKPPIVFSTDEAQAFETAIARVLYEEPLIAGLE